MYRVRTVITGGGGGPYLSTFYFDEVGGGTAVNAVADTVAFWNNLRPVVWNGLRFDTEAEVAVVAESTGHVTSVVVTPGGGNTFNDSGDPAPWATQGLIRWRTGTFIGGREVRGRTFVPGVTEASNTLGRPTPAYVTAITQAGLALIAMPNSTLVAWSKKNGDSAPTIAASGWTEFASLRSRRD
jgi:hypothetical protein